MNSFTLHEKIGQLLMVGIPEKETETLIHHRMFAQKIASYILFRKNTPDISATQRLTDRLHHMAEEAGISPIMIAIDQEYGRVTRIRQGLTLFPAAYGIGRTNNPTYAFDACKIAGQELSALGINVNFAPVADVNSNLNNPIIGTRSYGEDPEKVSQMVKHAIIGYQEAGIICSAKHFPGHGDVSTDSHLALPVSNKTLENLYCIELLPFIAAIEESVPIIMTAHILFPEIDPKWPATLSPFFLTKLLRQDLKFQGVIISDDLEMKALNKFGPMTELAVQMIVAGCDMLIISENLTNNVSVNDILQALVAAVQKKIISESRLDQSIERILKLKSRISKKQKSSPAIINQPYHIETSTQMMRDIFFENRDSYHFPVTIEPDRLVIITDVLEIRNISPALSTNRILLGPKENPLTYYQPLISKMDEIFIFLSKIFWIEQLQSIQFLHNQKIRFFSLNNPYIQSNIQIPITSYINLYAECLPLEVFDGLIFANLDKNKNNL